jgi:NDP-sugar pyrophosphorylase family protein
MAGGRGSRLAPYTTVLPKPLMPLTERPILDVLLRQLIAAGVDGVTISVGHLGELIESWVRHTNWAVPIDFVYEDEPLGTAGALGTVVRPTGSFLALNEERWVDVQYGVIHSDGDGRVVGLEEKPRLGFTVSMGVYAMEPEIIDLIGPGERIDFPDLILRAIDRRHEVQTYVFDGYWRDIGNREDYEAAIEDFAANAERFIGAPDAPGAEGP